LDHYCVPENKTKQYNIVKIFYYKHKGHENTCQDIFNPFNECDRGDKLFSMNGKEKDASICCWYFLFKLQQANKKAQSL
jgi:hypothetical protein